MPRVRAQGRGLLGLSGSRKRALSLLRPAMIPIRPLLLDAVFAPQDTSALDYQEPSLETSKQGMSADLDEARTKQLDEASKA